ncbi:MAG: hypothetical protein IT320_05230 [Anaerolineae bacterium]|nr:hypothetical protein [Anaerolineae bacterium]
MTRFWAEGQAINTSVDQDDCPIEFAWRGRHRVAEVVETWVVDDGWWHLRKYRTYYKLATETGLLVIIFRNNVDGAWFLQRVYD